MSNNNLDKISRENIDLKNRDIKDNIQILEEQKELIDTRIGIVDAEHAAPKVYFADKFGKKMPVIDSNGNENYQSYYSIEQIDENHYYVGDLDFTYSGGMEEYLGIYDKDRSIAFFKFHYGIVAVDGDKLRLLVPIVYKELKETNSKMILAQIDDTYDPIYTYDDNGIINGVKEFITVPGKWGAINLDKNSKFYGCNIIPCILDSFCDFDLDYEGFAHVGFGDQKGYIAKEIDVNRYDKYLKLFSAYKKKMIDIHAYTNGVSEALKEIIIPEDQIKELTEGTQKVISEKQPNKVKTKKSKETS